MESANGNSNTVSGANRLISSRLLQHLCKVGGKDQCVITSKVRLVILLMIDHRKPLHHIFSKLHISNTVSTSGSKMIPDSAATSLRGAPAASGAPASSKLRL